MQGTNKQTLMDDFCANTMFNTKWKLGNGSCTVWKNFIWGKEVLFLLMVSNLGAFW
jgi:hypothetical protein